MKFYLLLLACLNVVCAYGPRECPPGLKMKVEVVKCPEENASSDCVTLKRECIQSGGNKPPAQETDTECPTGQRSAVVFAHCAADQPFCRDLETKCVPDDHPTLSSEEIALHKDAALERELAHKECPAGQRASLVRDACPGARDTDDCPDIRIECVQKSFGNEQPSTVGPGIGPSGPPKTLEELENELLHKECSFGYRPAFVKRSCPFGSKLTEDCSWMEVRCVQSSFGNTQPSTSSTNGRRPVGTPKTQEQLDQEMLHKQCPFGQRAALVKEKCPYGATHHLDCPTTEVKCVQSSFGNQPSNQEPSSSGSRGPAKSLEQLEFELMHTVCTFGMRPAFIKEKCPSGGSNTADCPPTDVRCVQSSFANDQASTPKPPSNRPIPPAKTLEDLEWDMMHMGCVYGERSAMVKEKCPYHSFDSWFCPPIVVKCVDLSFGNDQPVTAASAPHNLRHHSDKHIGFRTGQEFLRIPNLIPPVKW